MAFTNNLIIGLGGTGGAAVKAFREIAVERSAEHDALVAAGRRFEYLYIDSNDGDIDIATKWKHLGKDIKLVRGTNAISIAPPNGANTQTYSGLANVRPWIASIIHTVNPVTAPMGQLRTATIQGAGQRRRYGRLLAARQATEISNAIEGRMTALTTGKVGKARKLTFHVFATLGGGTGSGSIVDVLTLIPVLCQRHSLDFKIIPYLFIGGGAVSVSNVGYFFQNEFTALRDINALMANRCRLYRAFCHNAAEPFHDYADPISAVYISTEENGVTDLKSQVKRFAASCYDLISYLPGKDSCASRAFSGEDIYDNNPGEVSEVVEDPHTRERVVEQRAPGNVGQKVNSEVDRSYRFQTLSGARARHPKEELHGILSAELGKKVLERWIFGDVRNRERRDTTATAENNTEIFPIGLDTDAIASIVENQDKTYRSEKLGEFNRFVKRLKAEDYKPTTLQSIQNKTEKIRASIFEDTVQHVKPNSNGVKTDVESTCQSQAQDDHDQIIEQLERRRVWQQAGHTFGTTWGIADMVTYLESLKNALLQQGTYGTPAFPKGLGNMKARTGEWNKLGPLSFKTTPKPSSMFEYQVAEGKALIEEACDIRKESIRRVRNRMLIEMLEKDIELYKEAILELDNSQTESQTESQKESQKKRMENLQIGCKKRLGKLAQDVANSELHDGDDRVLVWNEEYLDKHKAFYEDDALCAASVANAMYACEVEFRNIVHSARNLVERAGELITDILSTGGVLWTASDAIHEELCNRVGTRQYPRAYAQTIYHYLAEKGDSFRDSLTNLLVAKIAPSAAVAVHGDPTCGNGGNLGPVQASSLGMSDAAMLNGDACVAHADMSARLLQVLQGKATTFARLDSYTHRDSYEIRLCYTQYYMPLRYFTVYQHLNAEYSKSLRDNDKAALYYSNIDPSGMLDPSPDRPDVLPETDPDRHTERENARAAYTGNPQQIGDLRDNGKWQKRTEASQQVQPQVQG